MGFHFVDNIGAISRYVCDMCVYDLANCPLVSKALYIGYAISSPLVVGTGKRKFLNE